jgi:acyl carrier protein
LGTFGLIALSWLLIRLFDRDACRARKFDAELRLRPAISDDTLAATYTSNSAVPIDLVIRVRRLFAEGMGYPVDRLLPDDDFSFLSFDWDDSDLIEALEKEFGIEIDDANVEATPKTIRQVSELVERLRVIVRSNLT